MGECVPISMSKAQGAIPNIKINKPCQNVNDQKAANAK